MQAVRYVDRKVVVVKHFGSTHTPHALALLKRDAEHWVMKDQLALPLLQEPSLSPSIVDLDRITVTAARRMFAYRVLLRVLTTLGFCPLLDPVTLHLIVMRLLEPSSKLRAISLLRRHFGIVHSRRTVYAALKTLNRRKEAVERLLIAEATATEATLSFVLYDVTTLYFESFREDTEEEGLRKTGFSKDQKSQQPQIVVGLLVTPTGFPLGYELFRGNTFEGHTMLPVLEKFQMMHQLRTCTVVADAAMLSFDNIQELRAKHFSYIVGARVANLSPALITQVSATLQQQEDAICRFKTKHGDLLCSFSTKRYRKDKHDMEKQIARAKELVASSTPGRKAKFVQDKGATFTLNTTLIAKTEKLLGIKGYVTNVPEAQMSNQEVIDQYRNLWHVEQTFRMAKSDLAMRPIFHRTEDAVRSHLLLCVIALATQKHLEQRTGLSLRRIRDALMDVTDITLADMATGREFIKQSPLSEDAELILKKTGGGLSY